LCRPKGSTHISYNSISSQDANTRDFQHAGILNQDQEDEMFVYGYKKSTIRSFFCYLCIGLTLGLLRLILHWWSHWLLLATHKPCTLNEAEKVLVKEKFQGKHSIYYVKCVTTLSSDSLRYVLLHISKLQEKNLFFSLPSTMFCHIVSVFNFLILFS
jgi:P5-type ATPase cation transporter